MGKRGPKVGAANAGRPRIKIDQTQFERLCEVGCTERMIAGYFACDIETLRKFVQANYGQTFSEKLAEKKERGKAKLLARQFEIAEEGNPALLIWLGKQHLDQRDPDRGVIISGDKDKPAVRVSFTDDTTSADSPKE